MALRGQLEDSAAHPFIGSGGGASVDPSQGSRVDLIRAPLPITQNGSTRSTSRHLHNNEQVIRNRAYSL